QRDYYRMQAIFFPFQKTEAVMVSKDEEAVHKARNKEIDEQVKPFLRKIAAIEEPVRQKLLEEKTEFHVRLAEMSSGFEGKTKEQYREETAKRFARDVKLQPEEIEALLSPEDLKAHKELQTEIDKINRTRPKPLPAAMGVTDKGDPGKAYLLKRGDWRNKGEEVQPGLPQVLAGDVDLDPRNRRRQLAEWISSADNPLTARVAVNRIWQYHFGKGVRRTPSDFGVTGDRRSHPELLDWLATEFVKRGWSWKAMHRLILLSNTYRQSSRFDEQAAAKDPENRLLWRMNPRRLEAEPLRDSVLAVSGKFDPRNVRPRHISAHRSRRDQHRLAPALAARREGRSRHVAAQRLHLRQTLGPAAVDRGLRLPGDSRLGADARRLDRLAAGAGVDEQRIRAAAGGVFRRAGRQRSGL